MEMWMGVDLYYKKDWTREGKSLANDFPARTVSLDPDGDGRGEGVYLAPAEENLVTDLV
jgi:hypothetical protein